MAGGSFRTWQGRLGIQKRGNSQKLSAKSIGSHISQWDAYPVLTPNPKFAPVRLEKGLFYVNAFEPFVLQLDQMGIT